MYCQIFDHIKPYAWCCLPIFTLLTTLWWLGRASQIATMSLQIKLFRIIRNETIQIYIYIYISISTSWYAYTWIRQAYQRHTTPHGVRGSREKGVWHKQCVVEVRRRYVNEICMCSKSWYYVINIQQRSVEGNCIAFCGLLYRKFAWKNK